MELREPPRTASAERPDRVVRALLVGLLLAVGGLGGLMLTRPGGNGEAPDAERSRELATRLKAAGALDEAALQYERYLAGAGLDPAGRARIAYSLGSTFLERGAYEKALRWFYEAELYGSGELAEELGRKIVHTLERLGRFHAAQSALEARVRLEDQAAAEVRRAAGDPVVARIGAEEIYRSDVERALDELPPELAQAIRTPADRKEFVRQYVAEELLWRKARKLEYDRDQEVARRHAAALKQLAVARLVEDEVIGKVAVDVADLETFYEANRDRYRQPGGEGAEPMQLSFEEARPAVERDYRLRKIQSGYQALIESELAAESVELFPEAMGGGG